VEPSRVLLPAKLDIQRLLDSHTIASRSVLFVSGDPTYSPHERHDVLRSLAQFFEIVSVNPVVTEPQHPYFPSYATTVPTDFPASSAPTTSISSYYASALRIGLQAHAHHSRIRDTAIPHELGQFCSFFCCLIPMLLRILFGLVTKQYSFFPTPSRQTTNTVRHHLLLFVQPVRSELT